MRRSSLMWRPPRRPDFPDTFSLPKVRLVADQGRAMKDVSELRLLDVALSEPSFIRSIGESVGVFPIMNFQVKVFFDDDLFQSTVFFTLV